MPTYATTDMCQKMAGETWTSVNSRSLLIRRHQMTLNEYNTSDCFPRTLASELTDSAYLTKHPKPVIYFFPRQMAI